MSEEAGCVGGLQGERGQGERTKAWECNVGIGHCTHNVMWAIYGSDLGQISPIIWTPPFMIEILNIWFALITSVFSSLFGTKHLCFAYKFIS